MVDDCTNMGFQMGVDANDDFIFYRFMFHMHSCLEIGVLPTPPPGQDTHGAMQSSY
jgi:hypothetical protein